MKEEIIEHKGAIEQHKRSSSEDARVHESAMKELETRLKTEHEKVIQHHIATLEETKRDRKENQTADGKT